MTTESTIRRYIQNAMRDQLNFMVHHPPDNVSKGLTQRDIKSGWIDIYNLGTVSGSVLIEVKKTGIRKTMSQFFRMCDISDAQRNTMDYWVYAREAHAFLAIGTQFQKGVTGISIVMIPWHEWVEIEEYLITEKGYTGTSRISINEIRNLVSKYYWMDRITGEARFEFKKLSPIYKLRQPDPKYAWGSEFHIVSRRFEEE